MGRYRDPQIEKRTDVKRPFWFIRTPVPVFDATAGRMARKTQVFRLGFCDEMTMGKAKLEKAKILAALDGGKTVAKAQITFGALIDRYLAAVIDTPAPTLAESTKSTYRAHIRRHVRPGLGELRLVDVDGAALEAWLNAKHADGLALATRKDLQKITSAIIARAIEWKLWPTGENPAAGIKLRGGAEEKRERRLLGAKAAQALLDALRGSSVEVEGLPAARVALCVEIAIVTGVRISEALGLQWRDVDWTRGTVQIRRGWTRGAVSAGKSEAARRVRSLGPLIEQLRELAPAAEDRQSEFVFAGHFGTPPDDRNLNQHMLRPVAKALGIYYEGFGFHAFRRLNITWRQEAGATPIEAMKAAGHARPTMTAHYTLIDDGRDAEQAAAIHGRLRAARKVG